MGDKYSLTLHNQSDNSPLTFAVYTINPLEEGSAQQTAVAWLAKSLEKGNSLKFEWTLDYQLMFAAQGVQSDVKWTERGGKDADDNNADENAAELGWDAQAEDYTFDLAPGAHPVSPGKLYIDTAGNVPHYTPDGGPSVALAIYGGVDSGSPAPQPTIVGSSGPNLHHKFTLHPTYYIDAGSTQQGVMVDLDTVTNMQKVVYAAGVFDADWTLNEQNEWVEGKPTD